MNLPSVCLAIALAPSAATEVAPLWRWFPDPAAAYGSIVAGDLTGDGVEDVVYLADGGLRAVRGVAWYQDTQGQFFEELVQAELAEEADQTDLALLPGAGVDGLDALVVVGGLGLRVLRHEGGNWEVVEEASVGELEHVAAWNDGGSVTWIAATAPGGWVHSFTYEAAEGLLETASSPFSIGGGDVLDLLLFNRDDDGEPELAIARDSGLLVHTWDGTHLGTVLVYPFGSGVLAAVLPTADRTEERLALVTTELAGSPTTYWLRVLFDDEGTLALEDPVDIGADVPLCLATGDWNADGEPDLAVSSSSIPLRMFENLGGSFSAEQVEHLPAEPSEAEGGEFRALVLADLDHDGDADGFFVSPGLGGALLYRSGAIDSGAWAPTLARGPDPSSGLAQGGVLPCSDEQGSVHPFPLAIQVGLAPLAEVPAGANELAIDIYDACVPGVAGDFVDDVSLTPLPALYPVTLSVDLSVPAHSFDGSDTHHYWVVEARFRRNVGGEPLFAYPTRFRTAYVKATWGGGTKLVPPGNPALRGQLDPLDDIPPYEGTPLNP